MKKTIPKQTTAKKVVNSNSSYYDLSDFAQPNPKKSNSQPQKQQIAVAKPSPITKKTNSVIKSAPNVKNEPIHHSENVFDEDIDSSLYYSPQVQKNHSKNQITSVDYANSHRNKANHALNSLKKGLSDEFELLSSSLMMGKLGPNESNKSNQHIPHTSYDHSATNSDPFDEDDNNDIFHAGSVIDHISENSEMKLEHLENDEEEEEERPEHNELEAQEETEEPEDGQYDEEDNEDDEDEIPPPAKEVKSPTKDKVVIPPLALPLLGGAQNQSPRKPILKKSPSPYLENRISQEKIQLKSPVNESIKAMSFTAKLASPSSSIINTNDNTTPLKSPKRVTFAFDSVVLPERAKSTSNSLRSLSKNHQQIEQNQKSQEFKDELKTRHPNFEKNVNGNDKEHENDEQFADPQEENAEEEEEDYDDDGFEGDDQNPATTDDPEFQHEQEQNIQEENEQAEESDPLVDERLASELSMMKQVIIKQDETIALLVNRVLELEKQLSPRAKQPQPQQPPKASPRLNATSLSPVPSPRKNSSPIPSPRRNSSSSSPIPSPRAATTNLIPSPRRNSSSSSPIPSPRGATTNLIPSPRSNSSQKNKNAEKTSQANLSPRIAHKNSAPNTQIELSNQEKDKNSSDFEEDEQFLKLISDYRSKFSDPTSLFNQDIKEALSESSTKDENSENNVAESNKNIEKTEKKEKILSKEDYSLKDMLIAAEVEKRITAKMSEFQALAASFGRQMSPNSKKSYSTPLKKKESDAVSSASKQTTVNANSTPKLSPRNKIKLVPTTTSPKLSPRNKEKLVPTTTSPNLSPRNKEKLMPTITSPNLSPRNKEKLTPTTTSPKQSPRNKEKLTPTTTSPKQSPRNKEKAVNGSVSPRQTPNKVNGNENNKEIEASTSKIDKISTLKVISNSKSIDKEVANPQKQVNAIPVSPQKQEEKEISKSMILSPIKNNSNNDVSQSTTLRDEEPKKQISEKKEETVSPKVEPLASPNKNIEHETKKSLNSPSALSASARLRSKIAMNLHDHGKPKFTASSSSVENLSPTSGFRNFFSNYKTFFGPKNGKDSENQ